MSSKPKGQPDSMVNPNPMSPFPQPTVTVVPKPPETLGLRLPLVGHNRPVAASEPPSEAKDAKTAPEPARGQKRGMDPELQAMAKIDGILDELSLDAVGRIIEWLRSRHVVSANLSAKYTNAPPQDPR